MFPDHRRHCGRDGVMLTVPASARGAGRHNAPKAILCHPSNALP
jgi:hypothetical protein